MKMRRIRRTTGIVATALALTLGLGACGGNGEGGDDKADDAGATAMMPAAEGTTSYPLTLKTWAGESELPERPERVAVIGFSPNLDYLAALNVIPVYSVSDDPREWRDPDWYEKIELVDTVTRSDPINFEGIAATEPDLIVAMNYLDEAGYTQLAEIAPVLDFAEKPSDKVDWRGGQILLGEALDLQKAAKEVVAKADEALASVKSDNPQFAGKTITVATHYGDKYGIEYYTPTGSAAEDVMLGIGFSPNPLGKNFTADSAVSNENLKLLDADVLIVSYWSPELKDELEALDLFKAIPAVADGRYIGLTTTGEEGNEQLLANDKPVDGLGVTWVLRRGQSPLSVPWASKLIADEWLAGIDLG